MSLEEDLRQLMDGATSAANTVGRGVEIGDLMHPVDPAEAVPDLIRVLAGQRQAILRLAREVNDLRSAGSGRENVG
jgi:hypothetical protein